MAYLLGNYVDGTKARVNLIYYREPSINVQNTYDAMIQGDVPQRVNYKGKQGILYMDTATSEIFYEYVDKALTAEELTQQDVSWLAQISTKDKVLADQLTDTDLKRLGILYPDWEVGVSYAIDDVISYHNELYKIIQAHTSQADWQPNTTASLYTKVAPAGVITEWAQPTGAHDAYNTGDQVTWNGSTWESTIDANVWEPGITGWTQL